MKRILMLWVDKMRRKMRGVAEFPKANLETSSQLGLRIIDMPNCEGKFESSSESLTGLYAPNANYC